jgi:hypothetical protein
MEFVIAGRSDAEYASDPETRRSVSGGSVFLCGTVIHAFSRMQKWVTLSVTEAEFVAAVEVVQNMCFARSVISSLGLKVQLPMLIEVNNKGAVDLINSWTAAGRTRHNATRINFLRELKDSGVIIVQWISNVGMSSDIFTKHVGGFEFYKHRDVYVRQNPSVPTTTVPVGEGVGGRVPSTIESKDAEADSAKGSATDTDSRKDPDSKWRTGSVVVAPVRAIRDNG